MSRASRIEVTESAGIYRVAVTRPCGHVFRSPTGWNYAHAAKRHGQLLATHVCGTCRQGQR